MANPSAIGHVSYQSHDALSALRHNAAMEKRARQRWFLRERRQFLGLTQDELAERAGLSKPFISQLERGVRQYTQETLELLADALECDTSSLIRQRPTGDEELYRMVEELTKPERQQALAVIKALKSGPNG